MYQKVIKKKIYLQIEKNKKFIKKQIFQEDLQNYQDDQDQNGQEDDEQDQDDSQEDQQDQEFENNKNKSNNSGQDNDNSLDSQKKYEAQYQARAQSLRNKLVQQMDCYDYAQFKQNYDIQQQQKQQQQVKIKKRQRHNLTQKNLKEIVKLFKVFQKQQFMQNPPKNKLTLTHIANRFSFCRSTIYKLYNQFSYDSTLTQRFIILRKQKRKKAFLELNMKRIQAIKKLLDQNPFMTQLQIVNHLNLDQSLKRKNQDVKRRAVSNLLKMMNYSKKKIVKVPKYRNTPQNIQRRYQYCMFYKNAIEQNRRVYFLDQSAFNLFTVRDTAWSVKGQPVQHKVQFPQGKNVSLIAIMSQKGIVAFEVKSSNFKRQHHLNFVQKFLSYLGEKKAYEKQYLIMDNCKIHDQFQTKLLAQRASNVQVISLPPYSPQLNPIENWFHQLKSKVRKAIFNTQDQLIKQIKKIVDAYYVNCDFSNYFRGAMTHVNRGLSREQF